jgi:hypothetical protein
VRCRVIATVKPRAKKAKSKGHKPLTNREAEQQSARLQLEHAERLFSERKWPLAQVVNWIAFKDPAKIDPIECPWRASRRYAPNELDDKHPRKTLLEALKENKITATSRGVPIQTEDWFEPVRWFDPSLGIKWAIEFKREDVLKQWPKATDLQAIREEVISAAKRLTESGETPSQEKVWDELKETFPGKRDSIRSIHDELKAAGLIEVPIGRPPSAALVMPIASRR